MEVLKTIQEILPGLTRTQAKIAEYVLAHPDAICFTSLRQVAEEIGVTETTILNFCKKTEFESFAGLKKAMYADMHDKLFWNKKLETSSNQYDADDGMLMKLKENQLEVIQSTLEEVNTSELFQFTEELSHADHIYICGHEVSYTIASNFRNKLINTGANTILLDVNNYTEVLDTLTHYGEQDVFVLITFPFYAAQTVAVSDYLASVGATVLAITDKLSSPIVKNAKRVLFCNSGHVIFHNSVAPVMALTDIIASLYLLQNKERFQSYNEKVKHVETFFEKCAVPAYEYEYFYNEEVMEKKIL